MTAAASAALAPVVHRLDATHIAELAGLGVRVGRRIDTALAKSDPETGLPLPLTPCPFQALLLAYGEGAAETLGRARIAHGMAAVWPVAGVEYVVRPGDGDILVAMFARRRAGFDRAHFRARWRDGHAPFGLRIDCSGYRQFHPEDTSEPPFDGVGMVFFRNEAHMRSARAAPELARDATRDEMAFIDHSASMLAMFDLASP